MKGGKYIKVKNSFKIAFGILLVVGLSVLVYAWAFDTDGGYNIYQGGICTDGHGNYTDFCAEKTLLVEYYPVSFNGTNETFCGYDRVPCDCIQPKSAPAYCLTNYTNFTK